MLEKVFTELGFRPMSDELLESEGGPSIVISQGRSGNAGEPRKEREETKPRDEESSASRAARRKAAMTPLNKIPTTPLEFHGTLMDGPSLSLDELAHWKISDEDDDALMSVSNPRDLLLECDVEEIEEEWEDEDDENEEDEMPCYGDVTYLYVVSNQRKLAKQLRKVLLFHLED